MFFHEGSGKLARNRLAFVLREDRTHLSMREIALLRLDVLAALSEYLEMDRDNVKVEVSHGGMEEENRLVISVPVLRVKTRKKKIG